MSGDTLFNTSDIVAEVAVVEKSLDKLSQQIRALNTAKVDAIQAELKKLGSSASTGVQEMAASIKSALDSALQLQKDYASGSLNITKREYATRLEEAKNSIATTALLEKQGFRSLLDDRKVYLAEKANLEKLAGIEAKRQALEQSLIANSQTPNSARDLVLNTKYAKDLENAKLEILENGASATLRAVERRERAILQMLQTGGDGALAIAQKKYGTDFVSATVV